jgi:cytochrome P450
VIAAPDALDHAPAIDIGVDDIAQGRVPAMQARAAMERGPVFRGDIPWGVHGGPCLHVVSAALAEDLLTARRHVCSHAAGWNPVIGASFGAAILNVDEPRHQADRRAAAPAFAGPALQRNLPNLLDVVDGELDDWGRAGSIDLFPAMRRLTFLAVARGVGGMEAESAQRAFDAISVVLGGFDPRVQGLDDFLARGADARSALLEVMETEIAARRGGRRRNDGSMMDLVIGAVPRGEGERDAAVPFLAVLLIAGHDSGMTMYSRALWELAARPALLAELREELAIAGAAPDAPLSTDALDRLPALERLLLEVGRLFPSVLNLPRVAAEDFEIGGYAVRAGTCVAIAVGGMHRRPDMHERPDAFDPDRWRGPAAERLARPFENLIFGGGPRICLGMRLAQVEFKAIVARAIVRYDLAREDDAPVAHGGMWIGRPSRPMRVALARR